MIEAKYGIIDSSMYDERYTLEQDDDGHWYIVPCRLIHEFQDWLAMVGETEEDYGYPEGVIPVDGSPNSVSFTNPMVQE